MDATTALGRVATDGALSKALISGASGIAEGLSQLKSLCVAHGIDPEGAHCKGMEDLVNEAHAHSIDATVSDSDVRDAIIIAQYQRMLHYALAGYGTLRTYTNRLDLDEDGAKLQRLLNDTYDGDRTMTDLATGGINMAAAA